jgi:hypothetical protein
MTAVRFAIASVRSDPHAATPTLVFRVVAEEPSGAPIQAALLRCEVYIDVRHRRYSVTEGERLCEVVGDRASWKDTMRPLLWATVPIVLSCCHGTVDLDVPIACTHDLEVASAKYLRALEDGEIPLVFMFSGTIFYAERSAVGVCQLPPDTETSFRLPVDSWREAMRQHFGDSTWIRLDRQGFDALDRVRRLRGFVTWNQVVEAVCAECIAEDPLAWLRLGPEPL